MSNEFYFPQGDYLQKQSKTNNQGRGEDHPKKGLQFEFNRIYDNAMIAIPKSIGRRPSQKKSRE